MTHTDFSSSYSSGAEVLESAKKVLSREDIERAVRLALEATSEDDTASASQ